MILDLRADHGAVVARFDPDRDEIMVKDGVMWLTFRLAKYRASEKSDPAPVSATASGWVPMEVPSDFHEPRD